MREIVKNLGKQKNKIPIRQILILSHIILLCACILPPAKNLPNLGTVDISPKTAVAGSKQPITITYTVGSMGVAVGGGLKVIIPQDIEWNKMRKWEITASTTNTSSKIILDDILKIKKYVSNFKVIVTENPLKSGDQIKLIFGMNPNFRKSRLPLVLRFGSFKLRVDYKGNGSYQEVKPNAVIKLTNGPVTRLIVYAPSYAWFNEKFSIKVVALDEYNNIVTDYDGNITLTSTNPHADLPKSFYFNPSNSGRYIFSAGFTRIGINRITVTDNSRGLKATSNPIKTTAHEPKDKIYWGDIHGHSNVSDGSSTPHLYFSYMKDVANLDFGSLTDHDYVVVNLEEDWFLWGIDEEEWKLIKEKTAFFNRPYSNPRDKFITFLGYEWTSQTGKGGYGHRNIYYYNDGPLIKNKGAETTPQDLWNSLKQSGLEAITISHHTTKGNNAVDWSYKDDWMQPLVEIFSAHGSSECKGCPRQIPDIFWNDGHCVQTALALGHRLGIMASGDLHTGQPGTSGLIAVFASSYTKPEIFKSMRNRQTYATSNDRIILEFNINGHRSGSEFSLPNQKPQINVFVAGTNVIEKIEIIKHVFGSGEYPFPAVHTEYPGPGILDYQFEWIDSTFEDNSLYYIRVSQKNNQYAWSSPIWVNK